MREKIWGVKSSEVGSTIRAVDRACGGLTDLAKALTYNTVRP